MTSGLSEGDVVVLNPAPLLVGDKAKMKASIPRVRVDSEIEGNKGPAQSSKSDSPTAEPRRWQEGNPLIVRPLTMNQVQTRNQSPERQSDGIGVWLWTVAYASGALHFGPRG